MTTAVALLLALHSAAPVAQTSGSQVPNSSVSLDPSFQIEGILASAVPPTGVTVVSQAPGALTTWRATDGSIASLLWVPLDAREGPSVADLTLTRIDQSARTRALSPAATSEIRLFGRPGVMREYRRQDVSFGAGAEATAHPEGVAIVADVPSGAVVLVAHSASGSESAKALAIKLAGLNLPGLFGIQAADPIGLGERVVGIRNGSRIAIALVNQAGQAISWRGISVQVRQIGPSERPLRPGSGITTVSDSLEVSILGRGIDPLPGANRLEVLGPSGILLSGDIVEEPAALLPPRPLRTP